ncbi:hypothetical protein [Candidatus Magnetominusculus dajiuhuensis]|uniref:hypothetical protein n=1 Tax=Candidatus Magnetominusculus dajiuhuensis TaxID=3137712 RepID=UPI003B42A5EC
MATVDLTGGQSAIPFDGLNKLYRIKNRLDFTALNVSASDVVHAVKVKANTHVKQVYVKLIAPEGSTATCTVGDATHANGLIAAANLNGTPGSITQSTIGDTYANGCIYTSDSDILFVPANNLSHTVADILVVCQDLH